MTAAEVRVKIEAYREALKTIHEIDQWLETETPVVDEVEDIELRDALNEMWDTYGF